MYMYILYHTFAIVFPVLNKREKENEAATKQEVKPPKPTTLPRSKRDKLRISATDQRRPESWCDTEVAAEAGLCLIREKKKQLLYCDESVMGKCITLTGSKNILCKS